MKIKDLSTSERPRERLLEHGPKTLSNAELIALILRQGSKEENVVEVAHKLLRKYELKPLSRKSIGELKKIKGIGEAKACQLVACFELSRRLASSNKEKRMVINSAKEVWEFLAPEMSTLKKEHFKALYLDSRKKFLKEETIFIGTLDSSIVHPREIFEPAIIESAAAIILVHNHPSGDPEPSEEDLKVTKQLAFAGQIMGIEILDHVIIGDGAYCSLREKGFFVEI